MRAGVAGLLAVATGPARLRAGLRRATRPVRRSASASAGIGRLRTVFPLAVFGGELLGVLGERLRALLAPLAPAAEEKASRASAWRRPGTRGGDVPARRRRLERPAFAEAALAGPSDQSSSLEREPARAVDDGDGAAPARVGRTAAELAVAAAAQVAGAELLEDRLRRYWVTVRAEAARRGAARSRLSGASAAEQRVTALERAAAEPLRGLSEAEIAQELRAFVGDGPLVRPEAAALAAGDGDGDRGAGGTDALWLEGPSEAVRTSRSPRRRDLPPPAHVLRRGGLDARERTAALRELADQMAAIVRDQAVRHGIDLP